MKIRKQRAAMIQNADEMVNYGPILHQSRGSCPDLLTIKNLLAEIDRARSDRTIDGQLADRALAEVTVAAEAERDPGTAGPGRAVSALRRAREILSTAAAAAPLVELVTKVIATFTTGAGDTA